MEYFILWIKSFFAWEIKGKRGVWYYYENSLTGKRKAKKHFMGHSPIDKQWLDGGEWDLYLSTQIVGDYEEARYLSGGMPPHRECSCHCKHTQRSTTGHTGPG